MEKCLNRSKMPVMIFLYQPLIVESHILVAVMQELEKKTIDDALNTYYILLDENTYDKREEILNDAVLCSSVALHTTMKQ